MCTFMRMALWALGDSLIMSTGMPVWVLVNIFSSLTTCLGTFRISCSAKVLNYSILPKKILTCTDTGLPHRITFSNMRCMGVDVAADRAENLTLPPWTS